MVQDATHFSVVIGASLTDGEAAFLEAQCTYASLDPAATALPAGCAMIESEVFSGESTVVSESGTETLVPVPVAVSTGSGAATASGLKTTPAATGGATPGSGSGSGSGASATGTASGALRTQLSAAFVLAVPALSILASFL